MRERASEEGREVGREGGRERERERERELRERDGGLDAMPRGGCLRRLDATPRRVIPNSSFLSLSRTLHAGHESSLRRCGHGAVRSVEWPARGHGARGCGHGARGREVSQMAYSQQTPAPEQRRAAAAAEWGSGLAAECVDIRTREADDMRARETTAAHNWAAGPAQRAVQDTAETRYKTRLRCCRVGRLAGPATAKLPGPYRCSYLSGPHTAPPHGGRLCRRHLLAASIDYCREFAEPAAPRRSVTWRESRGPWARRLGCVLRLRDREARGPGVVDTS